MQLFLKQLINKQKILIKSRSNLLRVKSTLTTLDSAYMKFRKKKKKKKKKNR